jgi:glycerophosphoryl diester phosphodiesterase
LPPLPINKIIKTSPLIIGHRGASAIAPENTLTAFTRAMEDGADGVELDVRLARDRVPVVIHDSNLRRTGLCEGVVAEMSSAELGQTDVGSWFNRARPQFARSEYAREFVPTLDQVFRLFKNYQAKPGLIYVEMKTHKVDDANIDLAKSVVQVISDQSLKSRLVVVSFNLKAIAQIKQLDSSIRTGALFEPRRSAIKAIRKHPMITAAIDRGAEEILLHRLLATRRMVRAATEENLRSVVWTVDDPKWMRRAVSFGIHALITNNPAKMAASINKCSLETGHRPLGRALA